MFMCSAMLMEDIVSRNILDIMLVYHATNEHGKLASCEKSDVVNDRAIFCLTSTLMGHSVM